MWIFFWMSCVSVSVLGRQINSSGEVVENEVQSYDFEFVSRSDWSARSPKSTTPLTTPVPFVTIHHSYTPPACHSKEECSKAMKSIQNYHMDGRGWWDIGYHFAVGSDGVVYEGRGWTILGAHALYFNTVSIGICLIGNWTTQLPSSQQIKTTKQLISTGVELGYIKKDYKLVGHRQVRQTECPGQRLFDEIHTWDKYVKFPSSYKDLLHVDELSDSVKEIIRKAYPEIN